MIILLTFVGISLVIIACGIVMYGIAVLATLLPLIIAVLLVYYIVKNLLKGNWGTAIVLGILALVFLFHGCGGFIVL